VERGPDGRTIAAGEQQLQPAVRGQDLVLTIDRSLQFEAERALAARVAATKANGGVCIVMDPRTGEILAMANVRAGEEEGEPPVVSRDNMAVTSLFEPGSVNKVVTMSGAIEDGVVTPDTVMTVPDQIVVGSRRFSDHDRHAPTEWSVTDVIGTSSNVGTIMVGQKLGAQRIEDWLRRFGLDGSTGLGFPDESSGILADQADWSGATLPSVSIGYGVSVSALQMLGAFNAVANDGVRVEPTLVKATVDAQGNEHPAALGKSVPVVSPGTAEKMTAMLANVVAAGTGTGAAIPGYTVAGKTGTARKVENGRYDGGYTASFAGFMPAEDPQLSAIVVLDEPVPYYGGLAAAPVFAEVSRYALRHFRIPPPADAGVDVPTTLAPPATRPRD
jgi:cell division protein FtsI (penicillin-binding protein 3)